jgi:acyl carrier protein
MVTLVAQLEKEFGVKLEDADLEPARLSTAKKIADVIERHHARERPGDRRRAPPRKRR